MKLREPDGLNYNIFTAVIDASDFVPQHRERTYIVGFKDHKIDFKFPPSKKRATLKMLKDILEDRVDQKYTLTPRLWEYLQQYAAKHKARGNGFGYSLINPYDEDNLDVHTRTLSARYYKDGSEILINYGG